MKANFSERLARVRDRIAAAAARSGRPAEAVTLVAVTKTFSLERVMPMLAAGVRHIGENRVQEALSKYVIPANAGIQTSDHASLDPRLRGDDKRGGITFHLIGQLQTNKAKKAVGFFDVIQSLDRLELAQAINRHAEAAGKKQKCLIEVKISPETTKSGLPPEQLSKFLDQSQHFPNLDIRGLMGIAPLSQNPQDARPYFQELKGHFDRLTLDFGRHLTLDCLSMGMSSDFEVAIEEGATMVRLGTALFGQR